MAEEALKMSHIVKVYSNGVMANKDVTLSVNRGEIHALSGENGAGKSTLMKILFGEEQPTSGEIYINGNQVHMTSPQMAIKLGVGMVHQHFMLVPSLTVTENIIMGMEPVKGIRVDLAYARQQVEEMGKKFNLYVDPDKRVEDLTVGQKQRVEILKALFRGAKILILDEPTAGLDPKGRDEILDQIAELHKVRGITIILVSHSMEDVAKYVERLIVVNHGKIAFDDIPKKVFAHYKELEEMGLAAPQITYIMHALKEKGLPVDPADTTVEEAKQDILHALREMNSSLLKGGVQND